MAITTVKASNAMISDKAAAAIPESVVNIHNTSQQSKKVTTLVSFYSHRLVSRMEKRDLL